MHAPEIPIPSAEFAALEEIDRPGHDGQWAEWLQELREQDGPS